MTALWGARNASQLDAVEQAFGWKLSSADYAEVDRILRETIKNPVGPEFMAPPAARAGGRLTRENHSSYCLPSSKTTRQKAGAFAYDSPSIQLSG